MKSFCLSVAVLVAGLGGSMTARAHGEEDSRVAFELESSATVEAGDVVVEFQLVDTKEKKVLTPSDLNITHEKKLHFLAYDPGLREFRHVHPEFDGKVWKAELSFSVNGRYFIWAQGQISSDSEEFNTPERLQVQGGAPTWPSPVLTDVRTGMDAGSVATLSGENLRAGKTAMLTLRFTKEDGSPADVSPYLGAFAHVIAVPEDGDSLIHVHPMNGEKPNEGMLHATFPREGFYRLWVQFIDGGVLKTVPLSVKVSK